MALTASNSSRCTTSRSRKHALGLGAHHVFDLLAHAVGRAGGVGDELAQLVEEPACGLRHAPDYGMRRVLTAQAGLPGAAVPRLDSGALGR